MTVGEEDVTVPAGTYAAKHLQTKSYDDTVHDWWLNEAVPGDIVKFRRIDRAGRDPHGLFRNDQVYAAILVLWFDDPHVGDGVGVKSVLECPWIAGSAFGYPP